MSPTCARNRPRLAVRAAAIPVGSRPDPSGAIVAGGNAVRTVFLECNGDDGKDYFGELNAPIPAGAMSVLDSAAVAAVLGADTWSGLLSCDVLSDRDISAQVLTRSDGALINSTYIDD